MFKYTANRNHPLITGTFAFQDSVQAFERAASGLATDVKLQIRVAGG